MVRSRALRLNALRVLSRVDGQRFQSGGNRCECHMWLRLHLMVRAARKIGGRRIGKAHPLNLIRLARSSSNRRIRLIRASPEEYRQFPDFGQARSSSIPPLTERSGSPIVRSVHDHAIGQLNGFILHPLGQAADRESIMCFSDNSSLGVCLLRVRIFRGGLECS
jgi:hypothetical protein